MASLADLLPLRSLGRLCLSSRSLTSSSGMLAFTCSHVCIGFVAFCRGAVLERACSSLVRPTMSDRKQLFPPPPTHPSRRQDLPSTPSLSHSPSSQNPDPSPVLSPFTPETTSSPTPPRHGLSLGESLSRRIPGSVENLLDSVHPDDDTASNIQVDEEELSPTELRELYDEEEINRFLHLFSNVSSISVCPQSITDHE